MRRLALPLILCLAAAACVGGDEPELELGSTSAEAAGLGPPGTMQLRLIPRTTSWHFNSEGIDFGILGPGWRTADQGPTWRIGDAPLGYGERYIATQTRTSSGGNPITIYARRAFTAPFGVPVRKLYLRVRYDDGFVFYLNGKEGGRAHMPAGGVRYTTLATTTRDAGDGFATYDISSQIPNLIDGGINQLAIEVHQASTSSSDLVLDAELIAWVDRPAELPAASWIARSNQWAFWDRGGDLGTAWKEPGFDDSGWSVGEGTLGYGEPYVVTELAGNGAVTSYFRTTFTAADADRGLVAEVRYDDGFVMYLNGQEIARRAMPAGPVTAATLSTGHEATSYDVIDLDAALPLLQAGENTLAVEVHQASSTSSDLVFDMSLRDRGRWTAQRSGTGDALNAVDCFTPQHCWAAGDDGTVRRTSDGGETWRAQDLGIRQDYFDLDLVDGGHGYLVGGLGLVMVTHDGGASWTEMTAPTADALIDVQVSNADPMFAFVLSNFGLWETHDGGENWTPHTLPDGHWYGWSYDHAGHGWLVGMAPGDGDTWAAIYRTDDGGLTWTQQWSAGQHFAYLWGVEALSSNLVWAWGQNSLSGHGERKMVTRDGGATWSEAAETSNESAILDMDWNGPELGWGVGYGGTIVHTDDGGVSWSVQQQGQGTGGVTLDAVACQGGFRCWAVGEAGTILTTYTWGD